jgi:Rad3-related DNA helicase/serine/threonine protein kinase
MKTLLFKYITLVYDTHEYKRTGHACQGKRTPKLPQTLSPTSPCAILAHACKTFVLNLDMGEGRIMADAEVELQQIGLYTITSLLHTDSASHLYTGKHRKKDIVIKVFRTPLLTEEAKEAFLSRTKLLKKLKHRHILDILDFGLTRHFGTSDDYGYLVMQYAGGETLRQRIAPGQSLTTPEVRPLLSPVATALHYAHASHIIHGNLHPGNLLYDAHNDILVSDFSLPFSNTISPLHTGTSAIPYMAPEQLQGHPIPASDQYALAVMVYEWLCGQRPYAMTEREVLLQQQTRDPLPPPTSLNANISPAVERVLLQALASDPDDRFPHIQAFADNYLRALMGQPLQLEKKRSVTLPVAKPVNEREEGAIHCASTSTPSNDTVETQFIAPSTPTSTPSSNDDAVGAQFIAPSTPTSSSSSSPASSMITATNGNENKPGSSVSEPPIPLGYKKKPFSHTDTTSQPSLKMNDNSNLYETVADDLRQGGILSQRLPGYEERPAQIEMAILVARSLTQNDPAISEAGTGTGKSLAYLVPIVRSGKVAIISTANKALQEQLFYKDIPFIQKHIKQFDAALVKGVGNYVCIDRLESERVGLQFYAKNREFMRLVDITNDPDSTFMGDFETLDFQLPPDIRGKVCADSDQCAWSKCGYFADCYVRKMRVKAERAQVIVVNHTLLLLDAAMDGYLLPERDVIVLDEAHHLEEEATRSFTVTVSPNSVLTLLAQRMLKEHSLLILQDEANKALYTAWEQLKLVADPGYKGRANLSAPLEEGLKLATVISDLADSLRKQRPKNLPEKEEQLYDKLLARTQNLAKNIRTVFAVDQPERFVYYVERIATAGQRGFLLQVSASPLDVTSWLKEKLFDKCNVICTSATLATIGPNPAKPEDKGPNFAYFRRRVGLDPTDYPNVLERILPLTFDYESNALLYLPRDLPAPAFGTGSDDYTKAIAREMYRLVKISRGRAFLLFSSKRMLDQSYELMAPHLDYPLLKQGDMSRLELTRRFREETGAILFGLKSFWEGVDIAGEALSLVVIDKLPFDPPDDPVHEARVAQMKAAGENWFGTYVLPQAVLRLKQGLGRLLRTREDRGVMAILDTRLHTKGYGKMVLEALPPARRTANIKEVHRFFNEEDGPF